MRVNPPWKTKRIKKRLNAKRWTPRYSQSYTATTNEFVFLSVSKSSSKQQKPNNTCSRIPPVHHHYHKKNRSYTLPAQYNDIVLSPTSTENNSQNLYWLIPTPWPAKRQQRETTYNGGKRQLQTLPPPKKRQQESISLLRTISTTWKTERRIISASRFTITPSKQ